MTDDREPHAAMASISAERARDDRSRDGRTAPEDAATTLSSEAGADRLDAGRHADRVDDGVARFQGS